MQSSYSCNDVEILLKDISGLVEPLPASIREKYIQSGTHYCEMLPLEYKPSEKYMSAYESALENYAESTATATCVLAEKLYRKKGKELTIVSLARAGIPIGILLKRYLLKKYHINVSHYAISIIRGRGIDRNAVDYILKRHSMGAVQFIDGWIGKGAMLTQLKEALIEYPELDTELGVVSDPANMTELCGTHDDILIPSSCLNATVTGLISRTFLRKDIIGPDDFHGAAYYDDLKGEVDLATYLSQQKNYEVKGPEVFYNGSLVAYVYKKHEFYRFLEENGVDWKQIISSQLFPDNCIYVIVNNTLFIIEVKNQNVRGSVDEKLQTCDFKKKQYTKLLSQLNIEVEYVYILSRWFKKPKYKDVLDYIISVNCHFYFDYIPLQKLGLPVPEQ